MKMNNPNAHKFCHSCGCEYEEAVWPRHCNYCKNTTWRNPLPVVVVLVPVTSGGIVVVRRSIEPQKGKLCLPGGFIDFGESWQHGAARELWEETGIDVRDEKEDFFVEYGTRSASNSNVLVFCRTRLMIDVLPPFTPNSECSERLVITNPRDLDMAFETHTEMATKFLAGQTAC